MRDVRNRDTNRQLQGIKHESEFPSTEVALIHSVHPIPSMRDSDVANVAASCSEGNTSTERAMPDFPVDIEELSEAVQRRAVRLPYC